MSEPFHETRATGYAICGEPRSGSTFLSSVLESTDVLGRPREYFRGIERTRAARRDIDRHLSEWVRNTASRNGVYGLKVFAAQFDLTEPCGWADRLPNLRFVHLRRLDVLGQAISMVRALQTQQFASNTRPNREPAYDRRATARLLRQITHNQARWDRWFARNGISPLHLTYEAVVADPQAAADAVADLLGTGLSPKVDMARASFEVQRDALSEEWRERFVREMRDRTFLDDHFGRLRPRLRRWRSFLG